VVAVGGCGTGSKPAPVTAGAAAATAAGVGEARAIPSNIPFESLEGPFWVADGGYLIFSDVVEQNGPAAKIYRYDPGTGAFSVLPYPVTPTSTNGLAVDGKGRLVACERWNGALVRIEGGQRVVLADHAPGGATLKLRADGNIYFTDTTWGAKPGTHAPTAVYRVAPDGALSVAFQVSMPNGVLLSPDGKTLYVGSDAQDRLWRLPVAPDGQVGAAEPFIDAKSVPDGKLHVPDGLCTDDRGRIFVTNNSAEVSGIQIFESDGRYVGKLPIPAPPSNCTFGGPDRRTLYVTTLHAVYQARVETPGLP
jgi:gluconolactonase